MDTVSVRELAFDVVTELAPQELPVFDVVTRAYLERPRRMARMLETGKDDPLGIGIESLIGLITPVAIVVASAVVGAVSQFIVESTYRGGRKLARKLLGPRSPAEIETAAIRALTVDQLAAIRETVRNRAVAYGSDTEQAQLFADSVMAALIRRSRSGQTEVEGEA
jgi:hypothetical protein